MSAPEVRQTEWESLRTDESRAVEAELGKVFDVVDAYRYNSASIRVRVVDARFDGLSREARVDMVEPYLARLPTVTQEDIMNLVLLAPKERDKFSQQTFSNLDFDHPSRSSL